MSFYPFNPDAGQQMQTDISGIQLDRGFIAHLALTALEAATASTTGVHAAVTDTAVEVEVTTAITNPPYPRNISATAGGTAGDIKAITVTIEGTNIDDEPITEVLPAFTVDTAGTVLGSKAFKTVTSITIPAHDGTGATTAIGFGDKIGLPSMLLHNTVLAVAIGNVREGTAPTVAVDSDEVEKNTVDPSSALAGTVVDIYYIV